MTDDTKARKAIIDRETLIPVGVVVAICAGFTGAVLWLQNQFSELRDMVRNVDIRVQQLESKVNSPVADPWSGTDQLIWTRDLKAANPTFVIPEPKHIGR